MSKKKDKGKSASDFSSEYFKSNKDDHYNFAKAAEEYLVSSGSMYMDHVLGGGFGAGLHRFIGANEGGKTNAALHVMFNMFKSVNKAKGLFIKAEGRLSKEIKERSGLKFVYNPEEWVSGTCLVFECNVFDTVIDYLRGLLQNNSEDERFCIIIDSMDGMIAKDDLDKSTHEARKVAAGALITSDFLKRVSLGMSKFGHMCIMISQVRSAIKASQYTKSDPNNQTNSSGGNAILHYPDWILEFKKRKQADLFLQDSGATLSLTNKPIGHIATVQILKSTNETTGQTVQYPIKYGRTNGRSIWVEKEVIDMLLMWSYLQKRSSWITVDSTLLEHCKANKLDMPEKFQGTNKILDNLEENPKIKDILKDFVQKEIMTQ